MGSRSLNPLSTVLPNSGGSFAIRSADMGQQLTQHARIPLTAAQLIAMGTTPVTVLPAPLPANTNQYYVIDDFNIEFTAGGSAFTGGGNISLQYHGGAALTGTAPSTTLTGASGVANVKGVGGVVTSGAAIEITNATAPFAAGTGTAVLDISYRIAGSGF